MARSMTAFSRGEGNLGTARLTWELRTVNHRFLELGLRLPEELRGLEYEVRQRIAQAVSRGKVDAILKLDSGAGLTSRLRVNEVLARQIITAATQVGQWLAQPAPVSPFEVLRWPGVLEGAAPDPEALGKAALAALASALDELSVVRDREGEKLRSIIVQRCAAIRGVAQRMRTRVPEILAHLKSRHAQRLGELAGTLDPARVEQECALLLQRLDVDEELDRLETHLAEVERVLAQPEPMGRRLDFLMQELNREANTLGSKSAHVDTSGASVELKVLIEQIREQIQNLE